MFAWGRGTFGRLGNGKESDELVPVQVQFGSMPDSEEKKVKLVGVAAGAYHSLALAGWLLAYLISCRDDESVALMYVCFVMMQMMDQFGVGATISVSFAMDLHILVLRSIAECYCSLKFFTFVFVDFKTP